MTTQASPTAAGLLHKGHRETYAGLTEAHYYQEISTIGVGTEVGVGSRSRVILAYCETTQENVAIKIIDLDKINSDAQWGNLTKETNILSQVKHENLVHSYCAFQYNPSKSVNELWLVMPVMAGSCQSIISNWRPSGIKDEQILAFILRDTLRGLEYLHENKFIHRDLKASNILIGMDGVAKIADFALTSMPKELDRSNTTTTLTGTPCWIAPEVWRGERYGNKADIWSFGVLCMELAFGRPPYAHLDHVQIMSRVVENYQQMEEIYGPDDVGLFSSHFVTMVKKCIRHVANERPSAKELLKSKFFSKAENREYVLAYVKPMLKPRTDAEGKRVLLPTSVEINIEEIKGTDEEPEKPVPSFVFGTQIMGRFTVTDSTPESSPHTSEVKTSSEDHNDELTASQRPERKRSFSSGPLERNSQNAVELKKMHDQLQRSSSTTDLLVKNTLKVEDQEVLEQQKQHGRFHVESIETVAESTDEIISVSDWNEDDVLKWLFNLGSDYEQYKDQFKNSGVDGDMLLEIDDVMLKELAVDKVVHRKKIMNSIKKLKNGKTPKLKHERDDTETEDILGLEAPSPNA